MNKDQKKQLLDSSIEHLSYVQNKITTKIENREKRSSQTNKSTITLSDAVAEQILTGHNQEQIENLKQLYPSPYFTRCDFTINEEQKIMYFSKFSFSDENIYSWITPVAALRFENPGPASYTRPDGKTHSGIIDRKDNYMIVDGKILFFSTESRQQPRELIYQEHFTQQKTGFILPEVVQQMEKSQDQVIRAHHDGPFIIAGPAGSGKTTLALHRVAYLVQSPETSEFFRPESILVLVQDSGSKKYFSQLLPDLGIKGVLIVTFFEWTQMTLNLEDYSFLNDYEIRNEQKIKYEYAKLKAIKELPDTAYTKNIYSLLNKIYDNYFTKEQNTVLQWQKHKKLLDRFDITILLTCYQKQYGKFDIEKDYYEQLSNGQYRHRKSAFPAQYNLIIVDEFQNYLPQQLKILESCINKRLKSIVYVGDLSQQTQLGTIQNLESFNFTINQERLVKLEKIYRNTKQILNYIKKIGYKIEIPNQIKNGEPVIEIKLKNIEAEISFISNQLIDKNTTVGILSRDKNYLKKFKQNFKDNHLIHCLNFYETQGVEFDSVFIVGPAQNETTYTEIPPDLMMEIKAIEKDLLYVALTRAMSKLYVLS